MPNFPALEFFEFDTSEVASPAGQRHIEGGSFAFKQRLSLGCDTYSGFGASGTLVFDDVRLNLADPVSHVESKVAAFIVRLAVSGFIVSNMRLSLFEDTALQAPKDQGLDPAIVQMTASGVWQPNAVLPSGVGTRLSKTSPEAANVFRQDGGFAIFGERDADVSQFVYTNVVVPNGSPVGTFGACGSGLLTFQLMYDFFEDA